MRRHRHFVTTLALVAGLSGSVAAEAQIRIYGPGPRVVVGWRHGYWHHGWHGGRLGYWWVVGPDWYFYPSPVYPYPDPYIPPTVVVQQPPAPGPAPAQTWYYCDNPAGYYPYVTQCGTSWRPVPAAPPDEAPANPPAAAPPAR